MTKRRGAAPPLEGIAQALSWAIQDPLGHASWNVSQMGPSVNSCDFDSSGQMLQAFAVFDSSAVPPIGIDKYIMRLHSTFRCNDASFVAALILVDRILGKGHGGCFYLTTHNVHRLFLACLLVAVQYWEDLVYSNAHYAAAGGVLVREINRLERVLLTILDFDLKVSPDQYRLYESSIASLCPSSPQNLPLGCASVGYHQKYFSPSAAVSTAAPSEFAGAEASDDGASSPHGGDGDNIAARNEIGKKVDFEKMVSNAESKHNPVMNRAPAACRSRESDNRSQGGGGSRAARSRRGNGGGEGRRRCHVAVHSEVANRRTGKVPTTVAGIL